MNLQNNANMTHGNGTDCALECKDFESSYIANGRLITKIHSYQNCLTQSKLLTTLSSVKYMQCSNQTTNLKYFRRNHFKHVYFLSRYDHASDSNKQFYNDLHFRYLYLSAITNKFVFLLIDVGSALSIAHLDLTKLFVINIIQLLSYADMITIVTVSKKANIITMKGDATNNGVYSATRDLKEALINYVNNLHVSYEPTNHTLAFEFSFNLLKELENTKYITSKSAIEFVYVTRGLLTNLSDTMDVLEVIANGQKKLTNHIVINTCAVVLDEKRIMYEMQFLRDIAEQNYNKYEIDVTSWHHNHTFTGRVFIITKKHLDNIIFTSTAIFEHLFVSPRLSTRLEIHKPIVDHNTKDTIVSLTMAVPPFGVIGVNLYLSDLIEDVVNYVEHNTINKYTHSYAFVVDCTGDTIAHPAISRLNVQSVTPFSVDIGLLENSTNFADIRQKMLHEEFGNITSTVLFSKNNIKKPELMQQNYTWKNIMGMYIICFATIFKQKANIVTSEMVYKYPNTSSLPTISEPMPLRSGNVHLQDSNDLDISLKELLYHRLDLMPPPNTPVCRYLRLIATLDYSTLYLSPTAFESPFAYLINDCNTNQISTVTSIMAYIKDNTGLLANPGLRSQVRRDVNTLYKSMVYLKNRHQDVRGSLKNYIIRRYISTVSGVFQVYPGCQLANNFDPTIRPWYRKAMQHPGKVIITEPYLDAAGYGYIITIAHTIFEGKSNALHSIEHDTAVAIVALDIPYSFFYKMIVDSTPACHQIGIKCMLFENQGYLVAHPSMLEPSTTTHNQRRPHEHLTHKESFLANDILYHKNLVRKLACANYQNRTIQRFYVFNTSLTGVLTNVVYGERTKYAVTLLRGTNIFAAVLNSTCDGGAFCPCSTIDRICLNCNRMDQTDCECPCECEVSLYAVYATSSRAATQKQTKKCLPGGYYEILNNYTRQYSYCEPYNEEVITSPIINNNDNVLNACVYINCDVYSNQMDCLAVLGCEWCQIDVEGIIFSSPFCTSQLTCFNGVFSSTSPYGNSAADSDIFVIQSYNSSTHLHSYSAIGPVGGAIIVLALIIGFAIYYYRHNQDSHNQFYIESLQDDNYGLPLSRFNINDYQPNDEALGFCRNGGRNTVAERNLINSENISPYHMSSTSSYHRPPNGESDNGYSTMTPHEDLTDIQSFTLVKPLLLNEKRNSESDTMSISTSISSPINRHQYFNNGHSKFQSCSLRDNFSCNIFKSPRTRSTIVEHTTILCNYATATDNEKLHRHRFLAPVTVHRHMETIAS